MTEQPYNVYFKVLIQAGTESFPVCSDKLGTKSIGALSEENGGKSHYGMYVDDFNVVFESSQTLEDVFEIAGGLPHTKENPIELYPTYVVDYTFDGDMANHYKCWSHETAEQVLDKHQITVEHNETVYIEDGEAALNESFWELFPDKPDINIAVVEK